MSDSKGKYRKLFTGGLIGMIALLVCCFTPLLVITLIAIGASGLVLYLDSILFPALFAFTALTGYALWKMRR